MRCSPVDEASLVLSAVESAELTQLELKLASRIDGEKPKVQTNAWPRHRLISVVVDVSLLIVWLFVFVGLVVTSSSSF